MMEKLDELSKQRCDYEEQEQILKQQTSKLETENKTLKSQLNEIITEVTQKSVELRKVEKRLEMREQELSELQELYNNLKSRRSVEISTEDNEFESSETRLRKSERSFLDAEQAAENDAQTNVFSKIGNETSSEMNALATLVASLNEKLERKDKELTSCKRVAEETIEELNEKIKTMQSKSVKPQNEPVLNDQLDALKQRNSYLEKELESVRSQLTHARRLKDNRPAWRRSCDTKLEERSRHVENDFRQREAKYESQLADLQEERDQLHSDLLIKDEECAQISMCLDEALNNTNDLKQQIQCLETALEEKACTNNTRIKSLDASNRTGNVEIMEALHRQLEQCKEENRHLEEELQERNDVNVSLKHKLKESDEELKTYKIKLSQFEENNKLADRQRIIDMKSSKNDLNENDVLRKQIIEKDLKIKNLQAKLVDIKRALQRELKSSVDCVDGTTENHTDNTRIALLVSTSTQTDNEDLEYLQMNFKYPFQFLVILTNMLAISLYLKHVIIKFMCSTNEKVYLVDVTSHECHLREFSERWTKSSYRSKSSKPSAHCAGALIPGEIHRKCVHGPE
ncbi:putative leucine-rich repeat-containing protein DDB_G0290503 isoform X3 [Xenia sp. Carnegie-2017]|uniref:putative leucine-rich repeat-containing protein DDB_G0290503 isoform X3 n=1 Tax=Xenia sp. Carnegie-2017 TaxID=2897299 RepID=UPI001F045167|nr:putative leucine-rich repeat-containing protein DDB_G0290503 isoform X3 [Xenia sp. Carnegie-2017]